MEGNLYFKSDKPISDFQRVVALPTREDLIFAAEQLSLEILEASYACVQTLNGETLVLRRSDAGGQAGKWEFPGGKVEGTTETGFVTAAIETFEESRIFLVADPSLMDDLGRPDLAECIIDIIEDNVRAGVNVTMMSDIPHTVA